MIRGTSDDKQATEALAAFGYNYEPEAPARLRLWAEHALSVSVFRRCFTQWHLAGLSGQRAGLRYDQVRIVFDAIGGLPEAWPDTFNELQVLESASLELWSEQRAALE